MGSIRIQFLLLFIFLFWRDVTGFLCTGLDSEARKRSKPLPHQDELEEIFEAYDGNDNLRMDKILTLLKNEETDEFDEQDISYTENPSRFVVG